VTYSAPTGADIARWLQHEATIVDAMGPTRAGEMMRHAAAYITEHESLLTRIQTLTAELARVEKLVHNVG
jgi:hypothetical protein